MTGPTRHPRPKGLLSLLSGAALIGFVALVLSVQNAIALGHQSDQRNTDRIASDIASCRRGNELRHTLLDVGHANERMITAILDTAFTPTGPIDPARAAAIEAFRHRLDAPIAAYHQAVGQIHVIDCTAVTPGAKEIP